ncbi:hypothetical protein EVAR_46307_1 [Eumeta japonica]|uniref:Uncharacterized protein n=1 Tax=Eumeta variegata TaxID=151549 RepID=A0A4C1XZK9_EUMVA|nr:hypothetical protein EVAR_46307_1 [Eumeta japonica]
MRNKEEIAEKEMRDERAIELRARRAHFAIKAVCTRARNGVCVYRRQLSLVLGAGSGARNSAPRLRAGRRKKYRDWHTTVAPVVMVYFRIVKLNRLDHTIMDFEKKWLYRGENAGATIDDGDAGRCRVWTQNEKLTCRPRPAGDARRVASCFLPHAAKLMTENDESVPTGPMCEIIYISNKNGPKAGPAPAQSTQWRLITTPLALSSS